MCYLQKGIILEVTELKTKMVVQSAMIDKMLDRSDREAASPPALTQNTPQQSRPATKTPRLASVGYGGGIPGERKV